MNRDSLSAGLVIALVFGAVGVVTTVSFATLVFGENTEGFLNAGIAHFLLGGGVAGIILALVSSIRGQFGGIQDVSAALAGAVATSVTVSLTGSSEEAVFANVLVALIAAAFLTAIAFVVIGRFKLGNFVRFVPFPVMAGFLAATGWLLFKGGLEVAGGGGHLEVLDLGYFLDHAHLDQVAVAIGFGIGLYALTRILRGRLWVLPAMLVAGIALFYLVVALIEPTLDDARSDHWLIGPLPHEPFWETLTVPASEPIEWDAIVGSIGSILTFVVVAVLALLVTSSGLELEIGRDIDVNDEMERSGFANLIASVTGSPTSWVVAPSTALAKERNALHPLFGALHGALLLVVFLAGPALVSLLPRFIAGGLLVYLGVELLGEWIWDTRNEMPRVDLLIVITIVASVELVGLLPGVAVGLIASVFIFLARYSSLRPVRETLDGGSVHSRRDRPIPDERLLGYYDDHILILRLQGFLFFGSAHTVYRAVQEMFEDARQTPEFLILDMRLVQGIDSSAATALVKMARLLREHGGQFVLVPGSNAVGKSLHQAGLDSDHYENLHQFDGFDEALEWSEDSVIERARSQLQQRGVGASGDGFLDAVFNDVMAALDVQEEFEDVVRSLMPRMETVEATDGTTLFEQYEENDLLYFIVSGQIALEKTDVHGSPTRVGTLGRWNTVGELGAFLGSREPFSARVVQSGEILALPADALAALLAQDQDTARRLQRLVIHMMGSKLEKTARTLAEP